MSEEAQALIDEFVHGWYEQIEYRSAHGEIRIERRWQEGLLFQIEGESSEMKAIGSEPGGGGKPKSRPPGDFEMLDLFLLAREAIRDAQRNPDTPNIARLKRIRSRARLALGYDARTIRIKDTVCGTCGGELHVAQDASTDVHCRGTLEAEACGTIYSRYTWITLLG